MSECVEMVCQGSKITHFRDRETFDMDAALPYVLANVSALIFVAIIASSRRGSRAMPDIIKKTPPSKHVVPPPPSALAGPPLLVHAPVVAPRTTGAAAAEAAAVVGPVVVGTPVIAPVVVATPAPRVLAAADITGAGVSIVLTIRSRLAMILFRLEGTGVFTDPGGGRHGESALSCASRELEEESMGTFRFDMARLHNYLPAKHRDYQGYLVPVSATCKPAEVRKIYIRNLAFTKRHPSLPTEWKETDGIGYFFVDDLINVRIPAGHHPGPTESFSVNDVDGKALMVSDRVLGLVHDAVSTNSFAELQRRFVAGRTINLRKVLNTCPEGVGKVRSTIRTNTRRQTSCYIA